MADKRKLDSRVQNFIREALGISEFPDQIPDFKMNVNPSVDPQTKATGLGIPINPHFVPSNSVELMVGLKSLLKDAESIDIPNIYNVIKAAIEDFENKNSKHREGSNNMSAEKQVEENLRRLIRKMIAEGPKKEEDSDWATADEKEGFTEIEPELPELAPSNDEEIGSREMNFAEIAKELGFNSARGAQGVVDTVISKMRFLLSIPPEAREFLVLVALDDYIEYLKSSGEVTDEDEQLLRSHPELVQELDGFREHMAKFIRKGMKEYGQEHDDDYQTHFDKMQAAVEKSPSKFTKNFMKDIAGVDNDDD